MTRRIRPWAVSAALLIAVSGAAIGAPPTDEQVDAAIASFNAATRELKPGNTREEYDTFSKARGEAAQTAIKDVAIGEASSEQLQKLASVIHAAGKSDELKARVGVLAKEPTLAGFKAAGMALTMLPSTWVADPSEDETDPAKIAEAKKKHEEALAKAEEARGEHRAAARTLLNHPALAEAFRTREATGVLPNLARLDEKVVAEFIPGIVQFEAAIHPGMTAAEARSITGYYNILVNAGDKVDPAARERIRAKSGEVLEAALAATPDTPENANTRRGLTNGVAFMDGAYARGQLLGHNAPAVQVTWTHGTKMASLADLKGKVVVVDFWATWCGPCIASFPNVRKLQEHYAGYPVEIIGITSLQGRHISRPEGLSGKSETIDTKGDPEKEYALMPDFIKQLNMTWPVVFTEQNVFNPDFGVRGIPHVAIIDPAGVVRYNGLHPGTEYNDKIKKINGLLKEANLPVPPDADGG